MKLKPGFVFVFQKLIMTLLDNILIVIKKFNRTSGNIWIKYVSGREVLKELVEKFGIYRIFKTNAQRKELTFLWIYILKS